MLPEGRLEPEGLESTELLRLTLPLLRLALLPRSRTLLLEELFTLPLDCGLEELRVLMLPDDRVAAEERPLSEERL